MNVRPINSKFLDVKEFILRDCFELVVITESWLNDNIPNDLFFIPGYQTVRKDRGSHGGGLLIYLNRNISFSELSLPLEEDTPVELLI